MPARRPWWQKKTLGHMTQGVHPAFLFPGGSGV